MTLLFSMYTFWNVCNPNIFISTEKKILKSQNSEIAKKKKCFGSAWKLQSVRWGQIFGGRSNHYGSFNFVLNCLVVLLQVLSIGKRGTGIMHCGSCKFHAWWGKLCLARLSFPWLKCPMITLPFCLSDQSLQSSSNSYLHKTGYYTVCPALKLSYITLDFESKNIKCTACDKTFEKSILYTGKLCHRGKQWQLP